MSTIGSKSDLEHERQRLHRRRIQPHDQQSRRFPRQPGQGYATILSPTPPLSLSPKGTKVQGAHSVQELVLKLKRPRKIILLVKAGPAVDSFIGQLEPYLEKGDIIIDGGNSHYPDSIRRTKELEIKGLLFVGSGVSGGEEGARYGPSLMPGGSPDAWPAIKEIFQATAAQVNGEPCCDWVGETGAGHYVKMVHNGI
jgi:6-phosphogluconate dehydrogenase